MCECDLLEQVDEYAHLDATEKHYIKRIKEMEDIAEEFRTKLARYRHGKQLQNKD